MEGGAQFFKVEESGKMSTEAAYNFVTTSKYPLVFKDMISHWNSKQWSVEYICKMCASIETTFKVCPTLANEMSKTPFMETNCTYVNGKFLNFMAWLNGDAKNSGPLEKYPRENFTVYIDYKYMKDLFEDTPAVYKEVDWGTFGFSGRDGRDSTIWIASENAFTPLHQDTYGYNLVAQLFGKKSWTLFDPKDTEKLYPTRIPFEESSVFSEINIKNPDFMEHPKFKTIKYYKAELVPGDVLFVPKHWWHFVENVEPSVSINTWIDESSDDIDRLKEAVVRLLVCSLKESERCSKEDWLNPNEVAHPQSTNLSYVKYAISNVLKSMASADEEKLLELNKKFINADLLLNCFVSDKVIEIVAKELVSKVLKML